MRPVSIWTVVSAAFGPVFLFGGLTLALARQPASYNQTRDTISSLSGLGAADRWVMTVGLVGLGICYIIVGIGLRTAAAGGRLLLIVGGVAGLFTAAIPQPSGGTSAWHGFFAGTGFLALAIWPALAFRADKGTPWTLRPAPSLVAGGLMLLGLAWFAYELFSAGNQVGLSERILAGAEALWPLAVAVNSRFVRQESDAVVRTYTDQRSSPPNG